MQEKKTLVHHLHEKPFILAPMAGITDRAFRSFMKELGCGVVTTELVSATGLKFSSEKTRRLMQFDSIQHPIGIQLFGEDLHHLAEASQVVEQMGADFVDLNFGCPVSKVVKKGGGSAVLRDLKRVRDIFRAVRTAVNLPVTVKVRTGWDESSRNTLEVAQIAYDEGLTWVTIHGRTRAAGYSGRADWGFISEVKRQSKIPIIGNGDVTSAPLALDRLKSSGCDGIMIGRGCLKNPWIFLEAQELLNPGQSSPILKDFESLFQKMYEHLSAQGPETITLLQLKKFAAWYCSGFPNASQFRKSLFSSQELDSLRQKINEFFTPLKGQHPLDTSGEAFLMGGHG